MAEKEEKSRRQICLRLFFVPLLWQEQVAEGLLEGAVDDGWIVGVDGAVDARDKVASCECNLSQRGFLKYFILFSFRVQVSRLAKRDAFATVLGLQFCIFL